MEIRMKKYKKTIKRVVFRILSVLVLLSLGVTYILLHGSESHEETVTPQEVKSETIQEENKAEPLKESSIATQLQGAEAATSTIVNEKKETFTDEEVLTSQNKKVNINKADEATLTTLKGIGPSKAQKIISYREEHGTFGSIEDIMKVPGIKEATFNKFKEEITVSD